MDVADHQTAIVEYASGFHALVPLQQPRRPLSERRWYLAGADGALIADLVRNRLMVRRALHRGKPERIDYGGLTADAHNGADQACGARPDGRPGRGRRAVPVTPWDSLEAGLTVMAIDRAMETRELVDCVPMWTAYDEARGASTSSKR